jgi:hypothetical protein
MRGAVSSSLRCDTLYPLNGGLSRGGAKGMMRAQYGLPTLACQAIRVRPRWLWRGAIDARVFDGLAVVGSSMILIKAGEKSSPNAVVWHWE